MVVCLELWWGRPMFDGNCRYALRRKTFGKHLHEHQSIRMKIAAMARGVEQLQTWLEYITFQVRQGVGRIVLCNQRARPVKRQLCTMSHAEANLKIGDVVCLVKVQASKVCENARNKSVCIHYYFRFTSTLLVKRLRSLGETLCMLVVQESRSSLQLHKYDEISVEV